MDSFSDREQTGRVLSPYNRNRYQLFNVNLKKHVQKMKALLDRMRNNMNTNSYSSKYLQNIEIYRRKVFKINESFIKLRRKRLILNQKTDSFFLYLRNFVYILMKYITQIEICIHGIERLKKRFNDLISSHGFITPQEPEDIRTQLTYLMNKFEMKYRINHLMNKLNLLPITFDTLCNARSKRDFSQLKLFEINPSMIEWC